MPNSSPSSPSPLQICKIDLSKNQQELVDYVQRVLSETDSHKSSIMNSGFWNWQYAQSPGQHSCVYVAYSENKIAGYYHVPVYAGFVDKKPALLAMIQDVAVDANLRGQGLFRKLATFANNDIDAQQIAACYTFPNTKSIHTFLKYNAFAITKTFATYMMPVNTGLILRKKLKIPLLSEWAGTLVDFFLAPAKKGNTQNIRLIKEFDAEVEKLFSSYCERFHNYTSRSIEFLKWRYMQRPSSLYFSLGYYHQEQLTAIAIFKFDYMFDVPVLLLMDYAFTDSNQLMQLISSAALYSKDYTNEKIAFVFTTCCDVNFEKANKGKFIRIPEKLNPRKLNMLTRNVSSKSESISQANKWFATLGDWDVF
ncbi:MAG: GNAT family N-acetyltransferase [Bacteroidetes bacterium]|nr:GNAT family N-acetyltransferase [Bacteroidota bacterium]